ncbi:MAG: PKD domain-containing protein, partial [Chitinophagales bacterium]
MYNFSIYFFKSLHINLLTTIILLIGSFSSYSQNIVPNPGFESYSVCPIGFSEFNGHVTDWIDPSTASPDYMNSCANPFPAGVPTNGVGYQQTHGGSAYAGCYLTGGGLYTEYIQVQLTTPLVAGSSYEFKMYVVLHNNSNKATDDIGAYISETAPSSGGTGYLSGSPEPQIINPFGNVITDTLNWQLISGIFTATGGEQYLTLGHFKPDAQTTFVTLPYGSQGSYYYFDDISVEHLQSGGFFASDTSLCEKFCIDFTDQSTNSPLQWEWHFPGGEPSTSTIQNPIQICYQEPGVYDVTLITTTTNGNDTLTLEDYVNVHATPPLPVITQDGWVLTCSPSFSYQWQLNATDISGATDQSFTITQSGIYTVLVGDSFGCNNSASTEFISTAVSGLNGEDHFVVYPNPTHGIFTIDFFEDVINIATDDEVWLVMEN